MLFNAAGIELTTEIALSKPPWLSYDQPKLGVLVIQAPKRIYISRPHTPYGIDNTSRPLFSRTSRKAVRLANPFTQPRLTFPGAFQLV